MVRAVLFRSMKICGSPTYQPHHEGDDAGNEPDQEHAAPAD